MVERSIGPAWVAFIALNAATAGCGARVTPPGEPASVQTAPVPSPSATIESAAPRVEEPRTPGCFDPAVSITGDRFAPKPVPPELASQLEQCVSALDPAECEYNVAHVYFEANRFELAGPIFRRIAMNPRAGEAGPYAAQLTLECLNTLGSFAEPPRTACFDEMAIDVKAFLSAYCSDGPRPKPDELCPMLHRITVDLQRLTAEKLVIEGDRHDGSESSPLYRRAGESYLGLFDTYCRLDAGGKNAKGEVPGEGYHCDEIIFNAYRAFRAARELPRAEAARGALLDPRNRLTRSPLAKKAAAEGEALPR